MKRKMSLTEASKTLSKAGYKLIKEKDDKLLLNRDEVTNLIDKAIEKSAKTDYKQFTKDAQNIKLNGGETTKLYKSIFKSIFKLIENKGFKGFDLHPTIIIQIEEILFEQLMELDLSRFR